MNKTLEKALYQILRPLAELLQRQGVAVGEVVPVVKRAFVNAASDALVKDGEKPTTARIAIQVGLTRKDVAAIRNSDVKAENPARYSRINRVISAWMSDSVYQDKERQPAILHEEGEEPNLRSLIAKYSGDMPFNSMKEELIRAGAVENYGPGMWQLVSPVYLFKNDDEAIWRDLGDDVGMLIDTIRHNLTSNQSVRYQRTVRHTGISVESAAEFRRFIATENQQLLQRFDAWLANLDQNQLDEAAEDLQVGVGIYYFEVASSTESNQNSLK